MVLAGATLRLQTVSCTVAEMLPGHTLAAVHLLADTMLEALKAFLDAGMRVLSKSARATGSNLSGYRPAGPAQGTPADKHLLRTCDVYLTRECMGARNHWTACEIWQHCLNNHAMHAPEDPRIMHAISNLRYHQRAVHTVAR